MRHAIPHDVVADVKRSGLITRMLSLERSFSSFPTFSRCSFSSFACFFASSVCSCRERIRSKQEEADGASGIWWSVAVDLGEPLVALLERVQLLL